MKKLLLPLFAAAAIVPAAAQQGKLVDMPMYLSAYDYDEDEYYDVGECASTIDINLEEGTINIANFVNSGYACPMSFVPGMEEGESSDMYPDNVGWESGNYWWIVNEDGKYIDINYIDYDGNEVVGEMVYVLVEGYTYIYLYPESELDPDDEYWYYDPNDPLYYAEVSVGAYKPGTTNEYIDLSSVWFAFRASDLVAEDPGSVEGLAADNAQTVLYDLQGRVVNRANAADGIYVEKTGNKARKVVVRK